MPPRPAAGRLEAPGNAEEQLHRLLHRERSFGCKEPADKNLQRLSAATTWASYQLEKPDASSAASTAAVTAPVPSQSQRAAVQDLLRLQYASVARGLVLYEQQLSVGSLQQQQKHHSSVGTLVRSCVCLTGMHGALSQRPDLSRQEWLDSYLQLLAVESGLLVAFERACATLARVINAHAAADEAPAAAAARNHRPKAPALPAAASEADLAASGVPQVAAALLTVLTALGQVWAPPGGPAPSCAALVPAAAAACDLAVAMLRNKAAWFVGACPCQRRGSSSRSSPSNTCSCCMQHSSLLNTSSYVSLACLMALRLLFGFHLDLSGVITSEAAPVLASNSNIRQLLLMQLGLAVQALHKQQAGRPPAAAGSKSRRQQPVPAYHRDLLCALGLAEEVQAQVSSAVSWGSVARACAAAHNLFLSAAGNTAIVAAEDAPRLLAPLLLVLVEAAALNSTDPKMFWILKLCSALCTQNQQRSSLMAAVGSAVLPEMLQWLLPATATAVAALKRAVGADLAVDLAYMHTKLRKVMTILTHDVVDADKKVTSMGCEHTITSKATAPLVAAFAQHGAAYTSTLEAGLRDFFRLEPIVAPRFAWFGVMFVDEAAAATNTAAALASQSGEQLFSLLVTALKAGMASLPASGIQAAMCSPGKAAYSRLWAVGRVLGAALTFKTSSSSSNGRRLWAVLLGRCLFAVGSALQQVQQASPGDDHNFPSAVAVSIMQHCKEAVVWLLEELAASEHALPGAVVQELRVQWNWVVGHLQSAHELECLSSQQECVSSQLASLLTGAAAAGGTAFVSGGRLPLKSPPAAQLGKALVAFGAAVAAQLPVKCCCNFHACSNAAEDSERELVGGKSCVCSNCKAARYCSRECQVAHYKGWHKAVCKRGQQ